MGEAKRRGTFEQRKAEAIEEAASIPEKVWRDLKPKRREIVSSRRSTGVAIIAAALAASVINRDK